MLQSAVLLGLGREVDLEGLGLLGLRVQGVALLA